MYSIPNLRLQNSIELLLNKTSTHTILIHNAFESLIRSVKMNQIVIIEDEILLNGFRLEPR